MYIIQAAWEGLTSSASSMLQIALIVFPLMILIEIAKDTGVMTKISGWFAPLARPLSVSNQAVFPLLVGLVFGLSYGSGVIINATKQGNLTVQDRYGINLFLAICHALVEDTLLLAALGAHLGWLLSVRLLLPLLATPLIMRILFRSTESADHSSQQQRLSPHLE